MNIIIASTIVISAAVIGYASYKIWGPDNSVEETCEAIIKDTTGEDVDLTPDSPETTQSTTSSTTESK